MKFSNMLSTAGEWLRGEGPHHQVVISSRVRLARNLRNRAFPGWAKKAERTSILEEIRSRVEELPEMQDAFSEGLQDLAALDKQVLVERHLISREHAAKGAGSAVVVNRRQTLSVMINEEDHLRMQSIRSGLQLKQAFKLVDKVDTALESKLDFAFDPQLSNQTTLGEKEEDIINRLTKVIETIIDKEHDARQTLLQRKPSTLCDQIGRAYGVLTYAHAMPSKEALNLLSVIKIGIDLGAFPEHQRLQIDELFIETQPAHLQKNSQQKLNAEERDYLRAQIIRDRLKIFPKPDISKMVRESGPGLTNGPSNNE